MHYLTIRASLAHRLSPFLLKGLKDPSMAPRPSLFLLKGLKGPPMAPRVRSKVVRNDITLRQKKTFFWSLEGI